MAEGLAVSMLAQINGLLRNRELGEYQLTLEVTLC